MNAVTFLKKQHEKIRQIFSEIPTHPREETQKKMFSELCTFLIQHETTEQTVWYPRLKQLTIEKISTEIQKLIAEEKKAEKLIQEINSIRSFQEWGEKVSQLNKDVDQHASEEEQILFPEVEEHIDEAQLKTIGSEMYQFFYKAS